MSENPSAITYHARSVFFGKLPWHAAKPHTREARLSDAEMATQLDPEAWFAYEEIATALQTLKRFPEALEAIDRAIALQPDFRAVSRLLWPRARLLRDLGRVDEAISAGEVAIIRSLQTDPNYARFLFGNLQQLGYWNDNDWNKRGMTTITDAATACMHDDQCW